MKKNRLLWVLIPGAGILIAAVIAVSWILISEEQKEERYYEQMRAAGMYLEQADYSKMISAYEAAIELKPEQADAYIGLAEYYLEEGQYYEADEIAQMGWLKTNNARLQDLIKFIETRRADEFKAHAEKVLALDPEEQEENTERLLLRNNVIGMIGDYCYQQYVNEYKRVDVSYVSAEEGYRAEFKGLNLYAYFKNTSGNNNMVDEYTKKPMPKAKPYKVTVLTPEALFVGFNGYIASSRMAELFNIEPASVLAGEEDGWYLTFDYLGCTIKIETDASGNVCEEKPVIELYPLNLVSDWEEEEEEEEEEPVDDGTFVLAGEIYTYDITELYITDAGLDNLEPLSRCKDLRSIMFINCRIDDLSPVSGCSALQELNLQGSSGGLDLSCLSGLTSLRYLGFHECKDIDDLSGIMGIALELLHPCGSSVSYDQCVAYQEKYPDCEVWFDYYRMRY